jgi:hypothetical protein
MPHSHQIAAETLEQIRACIPAIRSLDSDEQQLLCEIIYRGIVRQVLRDIWQVWNYDGPDPREALLELLDPSVFQSDCAGNRVTSNIQTRHWREWYPGLDNNESTLGEILDSLPGFTADEIPALVRIFENPESPIALAGACSLEQHDAIHVLLGRGLVDQDEAFIIGFTAGASRDPLTEPERLAYHIALQSYQEPYRIKGKDLLAFDLGVKAGTICGCSQLHALDVPRIRHRKLGELRAELGIDVKILREFYQLEKLIIPGTPASLRLPV